MMGRRSGPWPATETPEVIAPVRSASLVRNSAINLVGQSIPIAVAILSIPALIHGLGTDRFGFLTLAWLAIGYLSLFDLGLGRAVTQVVAERLERGDLRTTSRIVWSAAWLSLLFGIVGAVAAAVLAEPLTVHLLRLPVALEGEARTSFLLMAASIPVVIVTAVLAGVLAALQRFDLLNAIRAPLGIFNYAAPLLVLQFTPDLAWIVAALVVGRIFACVAHVHLCFRAMPALRVHREPSLALIRPLFAFGAWITVSNVVSPLMVYLDRLVVGAMLTVEAVAYYATPYELVNKLLVLPVAIVGVLYPAFAATHAVSSARTAALFARGIKAVGLLLAPVLLLFVTFAHEGLGIWLGPEFAGHAAPVLRWLAIGVLINAFAQVASTLVQGVGRPALTAKLHLVELPLYLPFLLFAVDRYGITGAAIAWTLRVALDGALLFVIAARLLEARAEVARLALGIVATVALVGLPMAIDAWPLRAIVAGALLVAMLPVGWRWVLSDDDREWIVVRIERLRVRRAAA